jgi:hypothetical protein
LQSCLKTDAGRSLTKRRVFHMPRDRQAALCEQTLAPGWRRVPRLHSPTQSPQDRRNLGQFAECHSIPLGNEPRWRWGIRGTGGSRDWGDWGQRGGIEGSLPKPGLVGYSRESVSRCRSSLARG